jgi:hypothetical protein
MATEAVLTERGERWGPAVLRLAVAAVLVLVVLGGSLRVAGAAEPIVTRNVKISKEAFIKGCLEESSGITILTEYPDGTLECEHETYSMLCNFETKICVTVFLPGAGQDSTTTHGPVGGDTAADSGGTSSGTGTTGGTRQVANSGPVLALEDDEQP